ncbi:MAG: cellulase family glycosylhydrolase [Cyanobacteria bacterium SZAS TMP-1]|nr:cellulase family glycosylhydrolase [Cyanobacteria bacterium SZAS TMP-1]
MPNPCHDQANRPTDNVSANATGENAGIVSAAQEAYQPRHTDCHLPPAPGQPRDAQELLFDDIFKAIDRNRDGNINLQEFTAFSQLIAPLNPGGNRPGVNPPGHGHDVLPSPVPPPDVTIDPIETRHPPDVTIDPIETGRPPVSNDPLPRPHPPTDTTPVTGNFSSRNGRIYDPSGKEFQPRGFDVDNPQVALQDIDKITNDWSVNMIRINAPQKTAYGQVNNYDREMMQKVVDAYTKRGVVVEIVDGIGKYANWGSISSGNELKEREKFAREIGEQFKNNPYVWFATPNETGGAIKANSKEDQAWLQEERTYDRAIRSTGNKNIIVQGDDFWGQGATAGGQSAIVRHADDFKQIGNIVAGQHVYNGSANADRQLTDAVNQMRNNGFAVIVDEFGYVNAGDGTHPVNTQSGSDAVFRAVERLGIGALPFRWATSGGDRVYNFTRDIRGNGPRTAWGQQIWNMTHGD